jgi:hypothetical protein
MSHTPGPWKVGEGEPFVYALNEGGTNRFFLSVQAGWITEGRRNRADDQRTSQEECQANANLIAAAPELLEALKPILYESSNGFLGFHNLNEENARRIKAAIAKAEGK